MGGCCSQPEEREVPAELEPKSFISTSRLENRFVEKEPQPSVEEAYKEYIEAHFNSMAQSLSRDDVERLKGEMHQHPRSKDRLKKILEEVYTSSMTSAQLLELMRMVSLDDHKRDIMTELYCHVSDRENFEETVVAQFSLSDTLRKRTIEKLHEKLLARMTEHAETGELPVTGATVAGIESPQATPKAAAAQEEEAAFQEAAPGEEAAQESRSEPAPPPAGGCFGCCGAGNVDTDAEGCAPTAVEEGAIAVPENDEAEPQASAAEEEEDGTNDAAKAAEGAEEEANGAPQKITSEK